MFASALRLNEALLKHSSSLSSIANKIAYDNTMVMALGIDVDKGLASKEVAARRAKVCLTKTHTDLRQSRGAKPN